MEKLVPGVKKGPANFRWFTTHTSIIKMRFSSTSANLLVGDRSALWFTDFETPAGNKTDPILNNYLIQTMENNARSGVQTEKSFIFIFPSVVQTEKPTLSLESSINVQTT